MIGQVTAAAEPKVMKFNGKLVLVVVPSKPGRLKGGPGGFPVPIPATALRVTVLPTMLIIVVPAAKSWLARNTAGSPLSKTGPLSDLRGPAGPAWEPVESA